MEKDVNHTPTTPRHVGLGSIAHTQKMSLCLCITLIFFITQNARYYVVSMNVFGGMQALWFLVITYITHIDSVVKFSIVKRRPKVLIHEYH